LAQRVWRQPKVVLPAIGVAAAIAAAVYFGLFHAGMPQPPAGTILPSSANVISTMLHKSAPHPALHLANPDQPAPTDSWYSSLAFAEPSDPVYAYPWSLQTTKTGASLSVPAVSSTPNTVFAEHGADLKVDVGADSADVGPHNDMSVVIDYQKGGQTIASSRLTHGSPYIFFTLKNHHASLTTTGNVQPRGNHGYILIVKSQRYGLWLPAGAHAQLHGSQLSLDAGRFTLIALAGSSSDGTFFKFAANQIQSASTTYKVSGTQSTTTFKLATSNSQPTVFGLLPHQYEHMPNVQAIDTLPTLLGQQKFVIGNTFSYRLNGAVSDDKIITRQLSSAQAAKLKSLLQADAGNLKFTKTDPYFAGKQLYRAANLLELSHELNMPSLASNIQQKLAAELGQWLDPNGYKSRPNKYFYYDPAIRGVVGVTPSFGNEKFNDHHFQYGYFIYAAAVLGRYDTDFAHEHQAMINVLVKDIASPMASQYFPKLRNFDAYTGHSWADGFGLFTDGNNQESSGEAVDAWYAIYLWAQTIHNQKLADLGQWLYQNEVNAALAYWLNPDMQTPPFKQYQHKTIGIVWGGKLDYATFFSSKPAAPLGIQLIPMSPGQSNVAADKSRVKQNLASLNGQSIDQFKDYLLLYRAYANPPAAEQGLTKIKPADIDDADSLTYLYARVYDLQP